jgi:hypothetical protein
MLCDQYSAPTGRNDTAPAAKRARSGGQFRFLTSHVNMESQLAQKLRLACDA